mmetsp:Transcript_7854/g.13910  ORF Transcript_7854/g.13910 Transcript_7854/m.13910 type:complete len:328 (-) Transcript_7854:1376-2359(-)
MGLKQVFFVSPVPLLDHRQSSLPNRSSLVPKGAPPSHGSTKLTPMMLFGGSKNKTNNNNAGNGGLGDWLKKIGDDMEHAFVGRREQMWTPDQRPENQRRIPYDRSKSVLSWGNKAERLATQAEQRRLLDRIAMSSLESEESKAEDGESSSSTATMNTATRLYESPEMMNEHMKATFDAKLEQMADWADVPDREKYPQERMINGVELAEMCFEKYGKYHQIGLVVNKIRLPFNEEHNLLVAINFYVEELGGFGFRMTEEQYLSKLDGIASILNVLDQAWFVKKFLREPPRSRRGLPSSPREAFAVTLGLNESPTWNYLPKELIRELFG